MERFSWSAGPFFAFLLFATALSVTARSYAQNAGAPPGTDEIRVRSNEVVSPVTVTDKTGEIVLDLSQKDFHVFDNGVEQTIAHWDLGGDPLAIGLVLETSSRVKAMIPAIHSLGSIFTESVLALNGEGAVITYDNDVNLVQPFTHDHDRLEKSIVDAKFIVPETKLYDGMARGVSLLKSQPRTSRRILVVVGESQDSSSITNLGQVLRDAVAANIMIYGVGLSSTTADLRYGTLEQRDGKKFTDQLPKGLPAISTHGPGADPMGRPYYDAMTPAMWLLTRVTNRMNAHQLEIAAAATGGIHYSAFRDSTISSLLDRIGGELHAQYIVGYVPKDNSAGFHRITITVARPGVTVRARPGYFAGSQ